MLELQRVLSFVVERLAVSLSDLAKRFDRTEEEMQTELKPLVDRELIRETTAGEKVIYSITAAGASTLDRPSLSKKLAAKL